MAKIQLQKGGFTLIPEGVHKFKITKVDDSKYEAFGKLVIEMQTKDGKKHTEQYSFTKTNGEVNEGATKAFSFFAKTALGNLDLEDAEIDTDELVGCYIEAEIKHEEYEKKDGGTGKTERLGDWKTCTGFDGSKTTKAAPKKTAKVEEVKEDIDSDDVDDFLND